MLHICCIRVAGLFYLCCMSAEGVANMLPVFMGLTPGLSGVIASHLLADAPFDRTESIAVRRLPPDL